MRDTFFTERSDAETNTAFGKREGQKIKRTKLNDSTASDGVRREA